MSDRPTASLNPEEMSSGGFFDDKEATIEDAKFEMYDFQGNSEPAPCLGLTLRTGDEDEGEEPTRQYWSMGNREKWMPSDDGDALVNISTNDRLTLSRQSNGVFMLQSMIESGLPADRLSAGKASILNGIKAHWVRVPGPVRKFKDAPEKKSADILVVDQIIATPWDKGDEAKVTGKKAAGKKETGKPDTNLEDKAVEVMIQMLAENEGSIEKKDIPSRAYKALGNDPQKNNILALLFKPEFQLKHFSVSDKGVITLK